jgi:prepilin-type N-terminal cleavage/methylation domain-containing protein
MKNFFSKNNKRKIGSKGFSLIELMVSLTLFSITMVISVGTLLILIDLNAKAQAMYSSTTNLGFMLDSMTREIRMGYDYYCGTSGSAQQGISSSVQDCPSGGDYIAFTKERTDIRSAYRLVTVDGKGQIQMKEDDDSSWAPITSHDIDVQIFSIVVDNAPSLTTTTSDSKQPVVTVTLRGSANNGLEDDTEFNIQTRIIQRRLDVL